MNEKKAKKLRRALMTHDQWVKEKQNRKYMFTEFDSPPRKGNRVVFSNMAGDVFLGVVEKRNQDGTYDLKPTTGEGTITVGLGAIRPSRAACAPDLITAYKESKRASSR